MAGTDEREIAEPQEKNPAETTAGVETNPVPAKPGESQSEAVEQLNRTLDYVDEWLKYQVWSTRVPGAQVAIWFDGALRFNRAYGVSNVETGEALTTDHRFHVASHSKTFTATSILQLAEQGKLRLDDTVGRLVADLAGTPVADVTVRELLSHSGGITRDTEEATFWQLKKPFLDRSGLVEVLRESADVLEPNVRFKYTNIGYSLLGLIIEEVSGESFDEYTRRAITEPVGLSATTSDVPGGDAPFAGAHTGLAIRTTRDVFPDAETHAMAAATGFCGTAADMVRYGAAHLLGSGELLTDATKRRQRQVAWQTEPDSYARGYGLGLIMERIDSRATYGHSGGWPGHITRTFWNDEDGIVVSVLTNSVDGPAGRLASGIYRLLRASLRRDAPGLALRNTALPDPHASSANVSDADTSGIDKSRFAGRFAADWGIVDIALIGDTLYELPPGAPDPMEAAEPLIVVDETTLRNDGGSGFGSPGESIRYEFAADGSVKQIVAYGMPMRPFDGELEPYRQSRGDAASR